MSWFLLLPWESNPLGHGPEMHVEVLPICIVLLEPKLMAMKKEKKTMKVMLQTS